MSATCENKTKMKFLMMIIFTINLLTELNCDVTLSSPSIEGIEGETVNLTVTWTEDEQFFNAKLIKKGGTFDYMDDILKVFCVMGNVLHDCYCNHNTELNINATCSSNSIIWTFTSLEIRNNGIYTIVWTPTDQNDNKVVRNVTVRVFAKPSIISLNCQQDHCSNIVKCQCQASAGNPKSRLYWMLQTVDGHNKALSSRINTDDFDIFGDFRSNLRYRVEVEDHEGRISCVVENQLDSIRRESDVNVQFYYSPQIHDFPDHTLLLNESDSLNIVCNATAHPSPKIILTLPDGTQISENPSLSISSLSRENHGFYTCTASNCYGNINQSVKIMVQTKPSIISLNCQQDHCSNIVKCQCQASAGNPKSRLHWMLQTVDGHDKDLSNHTNTNDFDTFGDIRSNLRYRVEVEDHGERISCVVENQLDSIRRESAVNVQFCYEQATSLPIITLSIGVIAGIACAGFLLLLLIILVPILIIKLRGNGGTIPHRKHRSHSTIPLTNIDSEKTPYYDENDDPDVVCGNGFHSNPKQSYLADEDETYDVVGQDVSRPNQNQNSPNDDDDNHYVVCQDLSRPNQNQNSPDDDDDNPYVVCQDLSRPNQNQNSPDDDDDKPYVVCQENNSSSQTKSSISHGNINHAYNYNENVDED